MFDAVPPGNPGQYRSPFWRDFVHLNVAMMTSNNALVPDPDKQDDLASKFWQWPILNVGLRMCGWNDDIIKYFLLGNPMVYWGSTASLGVTGLIVLWYLLRWQRGFRDLKQSDIDHIHYSALYPVAGWFLHYLPFVLMGRVTYVHHYYPALYFAILTAGFVVNWATRPLHRLNPAAEIAVYAGLYVLLIGLFVLFSPIVFGMEGSASKYSYLKWFKHWKIA
jgi:dolichyl-phosphate-mannose-protein mannosyltransferase